LFDTPNDLYMALAYTVRNQLLERWLHTVQNYSKVKGTAYDTPILGYRVNTCNTLGLWKAEAVESFDFQEFNVGDYYGGEHDDSNSRPD